MVAQVGSPHLLSGDLGPEWDSNPDPDSCGLPALRTKGLPACVFLRVMPLQAEANNDGLNDEESQIKVAIAPNKETIKAPNGATKDSNH
ncbi:hypothetical protein DSO57_1001707 [Entomophthora muscae]|uniref:Uncharacterized protein n=1 Tax=Entomophthora muscae TaxID=34485 RepID=A0ACC2SLX5_9FUNG|nr:hypothetical protein DSO57_1001707 [Entomophthora muscae]